MEQLFKIIRDIHEMNYQELPSLYFTNFLVLAILFVSSIYSRGLAL